MGKAKTIEIAEEKEMGPVVGNSCGRTGPEILKIESLKRTLATFVLKLLNCRGKDFGGGWKVLSFGALGKRTAGGGGKH